MIDLRVVHTAALWATSASLAAVPSYVTPGVKSSPRRVTQTSSVPVQSFMSTDRCHTITVPQRGAEQA